MSEPLQTYTALRTEVINFLDTGNSAISNRIPTFIYLIEQELNRRYIPPAAWSRRYHAINSASDRARFLTLPPETVRVTRVHIDNKPYQPLTQLTPSALMRDYPYFESGEPVAFAILGEVMEFSHTPDSDYTVEIVSRQRIWPLKKDVSNILVSQYQSHVAVESDEVVSNYWTVHAADILLQGALVHGFKFMEDYQKAAQHQQDLEKALMEFERYTTAKALTANQGVTPPQGVMIV